MRAPEVKIKAEPINYDLNFSAPRIEVQAPRVEVRAEPVRANADFGFKAEVKAPQIRVEAPRVEVRAEPVRANTNVDLGFKAEVRAPKVEGGFSVKVNAPDLRMKCWNCGDHNLKLMSIHDLNKLKG